MMKRIRNLHFPIVPGFLILFACLCFFLAGCSGTYRTLPLPNTDPVVQAGKGDPKTSGNMVIGGLILGSAVAMIYASQHTLDNWGD